MSFVYQHRERPEAVPAPTRDPRLDVPTRICVLKGFYHKKPQEIGSIVTVPAWLAADMVGAGRAEYVEK